jgi:hypothetical protein
MKMNVPLDPIHVPAFRMNRVVMQPQHVPRLVQQLGSFSLTFHASTPTSSVVNEYLTRSAMSGRLT